jgi:hypothetical protein
MKNSNGTLGGGVLYEGRVTVIKGSGFVNSSSGKDQYEIQTEVGDPSERFARQE